jgi:hypothetical protein
MTASARLGPAVARRVRAAAVRMGSRCRSRLMVGELVSK